MNAQNASEIGRSCPVCAGAVRGRSDKIYCSTKCKTIYNFEKNLQSNQIMHATNKILRKNRQILEQILAEKSLVISSKNQLSYLGFDFTKITGFEKKENEMILRVFDFCLMKKQPDHFLIFKENLEPSTEP